MREQAAKAFDNLREFWGRLSGKVRRLIVFLAVAVLLASAALTVFMNYASASMKVLYPELSSGETNQVYALLKELNVPHKSIQMEKSLFRMTSGANCSWSLRVGDFRSLLRRTALIWTTPVFLNRI
jgi:hypothetical protein